ncbi:MAG: electron transport complex subunit E [Bacteroidales bacterium]|uniref:electron transport complex subunit E n=1 Tax=Porphyromonas sp. TaxID=1924944 RepID=UPI002973B47F|nr:electron transport complex subunit E [Porphyromonas sp.]MDD7437984.1 electron transport complex subunit E [Bacteroidales bacterium]MDY3066614.1 electron transport complex subunit E [Porphyromonas sp.]
MKKLQIILNGFIKENPALVLLLGMCPTLGTTSSAMNGLGMGLATTFVLICSNMVVSSLKSLIPDSVRIPSYIVIIATFTTLVQMLCEAYVPSLYASLGIFLPLIVVNCIVLGRAESFAAKNNIFDSALDGIGMGLGFSLALTIIGFLREVLGSGKAFDFSLFPEEYGALVFVLAPGAFIVLGFVIGTKNALDRKRNKTA